jgi:hypothetical protein
VRVVSGLADMDFNVGRIARDGERLVVESRAGGGVPTVVYVDRDDVHAGLRALLRSPGALGFLLAAPFRRATRRAAGQASRASVDDVNNPWR